MDNNQARKYNSFKRQSNKNTTLLLSYTLQHSDLQIAQKIKSQVNVYRECNEIKLLFHTSLYSIHDRDIPLL